MVDMGPYLARMRHLNPIKMTKQPDNLSAGYHIGDLIGSSTHSNPHLTDAEIEENQKISEELISPVHTLLKIEIQIANMREKLQLMLFDIGITE